MNPDAGIINYGNCYRLKQVMKRATKGEKIKVAFLGGSITQGCLSSTPELCYAYLTYDWWKKSFPMAEVEYINAGIGGTTSQFGVSRVDKDVLAKSPDVVFIEFSVNDSDTDFFMETYEGMVRHVFSHEKQPAVVLIHNIKYDDGISAERIHTKVAFHYDLPSVSMKSTIYDLVEKKELTSRDVTEDDLHPNDKGHSMICQVITNYLEKVKKELDINETAMVTMPAPLTANAYEYSTRYQAKDCSPICNGFTEDTREKEYYTDIFKGGWTGSQEGAEITFSVEGSGIALQYRKSVNKPAPVAVAIIDGDEENKIVLDANFDEDWGDCLYIETVLYHGEKRVHEVKVRVVETHEDDKAEFYLVSVIASL